MCVCWPVTVGEQVRLQVLLMPNRRDLTPRILMSQRQRRRKGRWRRRRRVLRSGAWLTFVCQQNCVKFNDNNNNNNNTNDSNSKSYNNHMRSAQTFYHDVLALTSVSSTCHIVTLRPGRIVVAAVAAAVAAPITVVVILGAAAATNHVFHAAR